MGKRSRGNSEGSIYHMKDGRWRGAVTTGWKLNAVGKKIPKRLVITKPTRHEVAEELTKALNDQRRGININPEKQTVAEFLKDWLENVVKPSVRPKTYRTYSDFLKLHISPALGSHRLAKLSPQHVRAFVNDKLTTPQPSRKKPKPNAAPEPDGRSARAR